MHLHCLAPNTHSHAAWMLFGSKHRFPIYIPPASLQTLYVSPNQYRMTLWTIKHMPMNDLSLQCTVSLAFSGICDCPKELYYYQLYHAFHDSTTTKLLFMGSSGQRHYKLYNRCMLRSLAGQAWMWLYLCSTVSSPPPPTYPILDHYALNGHRITVWY